jgi:hypothetical protein
MSSFDLTAHRCESCPIEYNIDQRVCSSVHQSLVDTSMKAITIDRVQTTRIASHD